MSALHKPTNELIMQKTVYLPLKPDSSHAQQMRKFSEIKIQDEIANINLFFFR
jgi:hypothetical protein